MGYAALDMAQNRARVDVVCNDPDNGLFAHCAQQIQIGSQLIELEAKDWFRPPRFVEISGAFRLSGKVWPICGSQDWVGNWCWNGYWMDIPVIVDFLAWLHGRDLFSLTCGEDRVFTRWGWREPFGKSDKELLTRLLGTGLSP